MAKFGEILAELRQDRRMTQKELGEVIHVTNGTVSNYETGSHYPEIDKLVDLANYFGVTVDYLLGRCSINLSPDKFDETVVDQTKVGKVIQDILALDEPRRRCLIKILKDMTFSATAERLKNKEQI